jgi:excinuclease UvrABC nuclease subunit
MSITLEKLKKLPDTPGVYLFKKGKEILYVGKATSLKSRVRSYLLESAAISRGPKIPKLISEAMRVDFEETDTVLEALIREAALIKRHQPPYNVLEKSDASYNYVVITDEAFPRVFTIRERELRLSAQVGTTPLKTLEMYGPFPYGTQLRDAMKIIRKIFPYRGKTDAPIARGKQRVSRFYEELGLAPKAATADDQKAYARTIRHLRMFFEGKKTKLLAELEREMKRHARAKEFETAAQIKRQVFALQHINDIALIKRTSETPFAYRIEAYDVAHTSGIEVVGVMTVVEGGEATKNEYRMFGIKGYEDTRIRGYKKGERFVNDTAALSEILKRRFGHPEWAYPRLIAVDGGVAQQNAAKRVLEELGIAIPIVAVTKNERHRPERILGDTAIVQQHGSAILLANSEAHRFAIGFHRRRRGII